MDKSLFSTNNTSVIGQSLKFATQTVEFSFVKVEQATVLVGHFLDSESTLVVFINGDPPNLPQTWVLLKLDWRIGDLGGAV